MIRLARSIPPPSRLPPLAPNPPNFRRLQRNKHRCRLAANQVDQALVAQQGGGAVRTKLPGFAILTTLPDQSIRRSSPNRFSRPVCPRSRNSPRRLHRVMVHPVDPSLCGELAALGGARRIARPAARGKFANSRCDLPVFAGWAVRSLHYIPVSTSDLSGQATGRDRRKGRLVIVWTAATTPSPPRSARPAARPLRTGIVRRRRHEPGRTGRNSGISGGVTRS